MGYENSGRRPQPTNLTVLRGNPSRKKLNENEPCPPSGDAIKPAGLSTAAGLVWDELAPICIAMKTLTVADVRPFATMCELQATMQEVSAAKDGESFKAFVVELDDDSRTIEVTVDNVLKIQMQVATAIRPYYALFGLEPISRARISLPKKEKNASKWSGILK